MMSEKDMGNIDKTEKFDNDLISTETLHDIRDGNKTHPKINEREARMAICDRIKQNKSERKGALRATHKMEKFYTEFSGLLYRRFRRNCPISEKLVQKCPILYQNLETLQK